ncbi:glycoside hydrolase family 16 protein [Colwelliaceae bacterium 6441]
MITRKLTISALCLGMVGFTATDAIAAKERRVMFDDFNYQTLADAEKNGWVVRTETGHPGIKNATWWREGISFHPDKLDLDNQVMRLTSKTDGNATNTRHTQICHQRKYKEGTYAARVYFNDQPDFGPDGDGIVETFYTISPLEAPMDKNYSEMDFEYLANGGWGVNSTALWSTSWETFQLEPWTKVNDYDTYKKSLQGWNTLVLQVFDNKIKYYINGELYSEHGSDVYPEVAMSLNFNLWFIPEQLVQYPEMRQYHQDVDWVYFNADQNLSYLQVLGEVASLRSANIKQTDKVPDWQPKHESYCGL